MFYFALFLPLENSDSLEVHILSGGSKLQIARSQRSDSGNYTCIASNMEGKAQKNYILSIQGMGYIFNIFSIFFLTVQTMSTIR